MLFIQAEPGDIGRGWQSRPPNGRVAVDVRVNGGNVNITYMVEGNMDLDTKDKTGIYKMVATPLNYGWTSLGGSPSLPTYGSWNEKYKTK